MKLARLAFVVLALVPFAACQVKDDAPPPAAKDGPPPLPPPPDVAAPPADALKTPSGIASKVLIVGLGTVRPTPESRVTVHYSGWTTDGKMFDSSYQRGQPVRSFPVTQFIPGWTEILQQMVAGEKRRVWIPGALAYDNLDLPNTPRGMLVFEIELLDVQ